MHRPFLVGILRDLTLKKTNLFALRVEVDFVCFRRLLCLKKYKMIFFFKIMAEQAGVLKISIKYKYEAI
jgi:hypothetical protein